MDVHAPLASRYSGHVDESGEREREEIRSPTRFSGRRGLTVGCRAAVSLPALLASSSSPASLLLVFDVSLYPHGPESHGLNYVRVLRFYKSFNGAHLYPYRRAVVVVRQKSQSISATNCYYTVHRK